MYPYESYFLCLGKLGREDHNLGSIEERGKHLANRSPLCGKEEENIIHLLLFCTKVQDVWTLLFTIFGVNWLLSGSVRETLEGW